MENKKYEKAVDMLRKAYNDKPDDPNVCITFAQALSMTDQGLQEAVSILNKYISLMPSDIQGYTELGNLYLKLGDKKSAINTFKQALKLNPELKDLDEFIKKLEVQL